MSDTLPHGWAVARVGDLAEYINGLAFKPSDWEADGRPIIRIQNLTGQSNRFNRTRRHVDSAFLVEPGTILVSWSATLDVFEWHGPEGVLNQHIFKVVPSEHLPDHRFLQWALKNAIEEMWASEHTHGTTMRHINRGPFLAHPVRLPPTNEQAKLAELLDSMSSRLDAAVASLEAAQRKLKAYRASVLKAAVEGRLVPTEAELARKEGRSYEPADALLRRILSERRRRWEEAELAKMKASDKTPKDDQWKAKYEEPELPDTDTLPDLPEGWCWATIEQLAGAVFYGSSAKAGQEANGIPVLRMGNIVDGSLGLSDLKYLPAEHDEFPDLLLDPGDLLFNRTNSPELVGKSAVYAGTPSPCSFASYLICVRLLAGVEPQWVTHVINSPFGRQWVWRVVTQQVGQANVNGSKLKALAIPLPPSEEQRRCVDTTDMLFTNADASQVAVRRDILRVNRLRKSILHLAFQGRLVDQDLADEPAEVLLARIRAQRAAAAVSTPKQKRSQKVGAAS